MKETLTAVIQTLCGLFEDKAELRGINDWDKFIECIIALQQLANSLPDKESENKESEVVNDG